MKIFNYSVPLLIMLLLAACSSSDEPQQQGPDKPDDPSGTANGNKVNKTIDIQGHRGARGVLPENTIPAFLYALDAGVTTLEMDVAVTKDEVLVVSHEPWMSHHICSYPDGKPVPEDKAMELNIYKMTLEEVQQYDCGSRGNERFPDQQPMALHKPTLTAVIDTVEAYIKEKGLEPVNYNIEIKSRPAGNGIYHPDGEQFALLVMEAINQKGITDRVTIQSFDVRPLQELYERKAPVKLAFLVDDLRGLDVQLKDLGFTPDIYSPNYTLLHDGIVKTCHEKGMQVIPWTVNDMEKMKALLAMGCDGIITDYPKKAVALVETFENKQLDN